MERSEPWGKQVQLFYAPVYYPGSADELISFSVLKLLSPKLQSTASEKMNIRV